MNQTLTSLELLNLTLMSSLKTKLRSRMISLINTQSRTLNLLQNLLRLTQETLDSVKLFTISRKWSLMWTPLKVSLLRRKCSKSILKVFNGSCTIITREPNIGDGITPTIMHPWFPILMKISSQTSFKAVLQLSNSKSMPIAQILIDPTPPFSNCWVSYP